jgi:hypothetical protein
MTQSKAESKKAETTPNSIENYKKAVSMGKEMSKSADVTKADVARKMFELIQDEPREVIAKAFVEGANLTPKGAMTYVYNIRRKMKKSS